MGSVCLYATVRVDGSLVCPYDTVYLYLHQRLAYS
jgi:hypothetical protein